MTGPIQCCTKEPKGVGKVHSGRNKAEGVDDRGIGPRTQTRGTSNFNKRLALDTKTICWNTKRFCAHVASFYSKDAALYQTSQWPEAAFRKECVTTLGPICLPQCRKLARLYDEASRAGPDMNGNPGNSNPWDLKGGDPTSMVVGPGGGGGMADDAGKVHRVFMYAMAPEDCLKCVDEDDCYPSCMVRGDCVDTGVEAVPIKPENDAFKPGNAAPKLP